MILSDTAIRRPVLTLVVLIVLMLFGTLATRNMGIDIVPNVVVPEGESITLAMAPKVSGRATAYELVYTPEGGERTVVFEKSATGFTYTLDGACTVQSLSRCGGLVFSIR